MLEFDPERTVPTDEWATSRADEEFLLLDPIANASALHDLYEARARIHVERMETGVDSTISDLVDALERMRTMSKLLPTDDPRSYEAYKQRFHSSGQQG